MSAIHARQTERHAALQLSVNTVVPLLPLAAGHAVLALAGLPPRHDVYAAILGMYLLWGASLIARQLARLAQACP